MEYRSDVLRFVRPLMRLFRISRLFHFFGAFVWICLMFCEQVCNEPFIGQTLFKSHDLRTWIHDCGLRLPVDEFHPVFMSTAISMYFGYVVAIVILLYRKLIKLSVMSRHSILQRTILALTPNQNPRALPSARSRPLIVVISIIVKIISTLAHE